jgi:hypothetical protein
MSELDFTKAESDRAMWSDDPSDLDVLSEHPSRYIRAQVAGNRHTPRTIRDKLRTRPGEHTSILLWILENKACSRDEFASIYTEYIGRSYCGNVHMTLAASVHATTAELSELLRINHWCVTMAVLNNYQGRDTDEYRKIIKQYLPDEDKDWEKWKEEEKLAYFRTYGRRRPPGRE